MTFCIQYRPDYKHQYVLNGFVGIEQKLFWFLKDVRRVLGGGGGGPQVVLPSSEVRVRHVAGNLRNPCPRFLKKRLLNHEAALRAFESSPVEAVVALGRKLVAQDTYVRILAQHDPTDLKNPTQLLVMQETTVTEMLTLNLFEVWLIFFKKEAVAKLYPPPYPYHHHIDRAIEYCEAVLKASAAATAPAATAATTAAAAAAPAAAEYTMGLDFFAEQQQNNQVSILETDEEGCPKTVVLQWKGCFKKFALVEEEIVDIEQ